MRNFTACIIIIGVIIIFTAGLAQAIDKLGYVDLSRTFDEYQKTLDYEEKLKAQREDGQTKLNDLVEEIKSLKQEVDLLGEEAKEAKQTEIDDKVKDLQRLERDLRDELRRERASMTKDILAEMRDVIKDYGEKEGYSLILEDRVLLYRDKSLDVTDTIIKILNKSYKR